MSNTTHIPSEVTFSWKWAEEVPNGKLEATMEGLTDCYLNSEISV